MGYGSIKDNIVNVFKYGLNKGIEYLRSYLCVCVFVCMCGCINR